MKLTERVYLVGSGAFGFSLTDDYDCHVYLLDGGGQLALIDAGAGMGVPQILENIRSEGLDPASVRYLLLTHTHADHAGGAALLKAQLGLEVLVSRASASFLREGDEVAINLEIAKQAGYYPKDYRFHACGVDRELAEGDEVAVGNCQLEVLDTPGHCTGSIAFVMRTGAKTYLFSGDTVFFGGKILLQNIHDCSLQDYVRSVMKLSRLSVDVFLPGHMELSLRDGQRHIESAAQAFRKLGVPPNLI